MFCRYRFAKELSSSDYPGSKRPKTSVSFQDSQVSRLFLQLGQL